MDKVLINNLEVEGIIGIFQWEREVRQLISIDIESPDEKFVPVTKVSSTTLKVVDAIPDNCILFTSPFIKSIYIFLLDILSRCSYPKGSSRNDCAIFLR